MTIALVVMIRVETKPLLIHPIDFGSVRMHANDQACEILEIASKLPKTAEILTDIWEYLTIG